MSVPRVESQRTTEVSDNNDVSGDADLMVNNSFIVFLILIR